MLTRVACSVRVVWLPGLTSRGERWRKFESSFPFVFFLPDDDDGGRVGESRVRGPLNFFISFSCL